LAVVKIGGVQAEAAAVPGECETLVDGAVLRGKLDGGRGAADPGGDSSVFGRPEKDGRRSLPAQQEVGRGWVRRNPGRHALAGAIRRRDADRRRRRNLDAKTVV